MAGSSGGEACRRNTAVRSRSHGPFGKGLMCCVRRSSRAPPGLPASRLDGMISRFSWIMEWRLSRNPGRSGSSVSSQVERSSHCAGSRQASRSGDIGPECRLDEAQEVLWVRRGDDHVRAIQGCRLRSEDHVSIEGLVGGGGPTLLPSLGRQGGGSAHRNGVDRQELDLSDESVEPRKSSVAASPDEFAPYFAVRNFGDNDGRPCSNCIHDPSPAGGCGR